jgi:hypothetical protein
MNNMNKLSSSIILLTILISILTSCSNKEAKRTYYDNGQLKKKTHYKDGKVHGKELIYYKNGQLKEKSYYKNGVPVDTYKQFYQNGQLKGIGIFKDGEIHGVLKKFYKNGNLKGIANVKEGNADGIVKEYYKNGQLKLNAFKIDSLYYFLQEFTKKGEFIREDRRIKLPDNRDTIKVGEEHHFTISCYGSIDRYKRVQVGVYKKNMAQKLSDTVTVKFEPADKNYYKFFTYDMQTGNYIDARLIRSDSVTEMTSQKKSFSFPYQPKKPGKYRFFGNYRLIPKEGSAIKYDQEYGFSVIFYVEPKAKS